MSSLILLSARLVEPVEWCRARDGMNTLVLLLAVGALAVMVSPYLRRESPAVRLFIIVFAVAAFGRYIWWRTANLPQWDTSWFVVATYGFLGLEYASGYLWVGDLFCLKRTSNRSREVEEHLDWYGKAPPRIDIFIATYNESWAVLERTLVGAKAQHYPNYRIWILDDGNRAWLREKAEAEDVGYITRSDNQHYKAGNLNHALAFLRARGEALEYVALLDADFVARPEFLRRSMALMRNPEVGIVQTPQCFYNPDPHQQAFGGVRNWPDEQRSWFDVYLPALDAQGYATCCGTSCLIRLEALDAIGGFPVASVCEDTLSSIMMWGIGKKTVFLHERLTVGLAPEGIGEFLSQRVRWLLGGVQNSRHLGPGEGIRGRLDYWLGLWRHAIWGVVPLGWPLLSVLFWFTGESLIPARDFDDAASYFGPLFLDRLFRGWLFAGRMTVFVSDAIWTFLSPFWVKQTWHAVMGSKIRFKVTDKALHRQDSVVHWSLIWVHLVLLLMLLSGLVYTLTDSRAPGYHVGFFQVNTALTIYFTLLILAGIAPAFEPPKRRASDRYPTSETVTASVNGKKESWRCRDISLDGVLVESKGLGMLPHTVELELDGVGKVHATLARTTRRTAAFAFADASARPALIRKLFFSDDYIADPKRWGLTRAVMSSLKQVFF